MNNSRDFIDSIENGENLEAESHFSNALSDKVGASLENRRQELAYELVNEGAVERAGMKIGAQTVEMKNGKYTKKAKLEQDRTGAQMTQAVGKIAGDLHAAEKEGDKRFKGAGEAVKVVKKFKKDEIAKANKGEVGIGSVLRGQETSKKHGTDPFHKSRGEMDIGAETNIARQMRKDKNKEAKANRSGGDDDVA